MKPNSYEKKLLVAYPNGRRVKAKIVRVINQVIITTERIVYLDSQKDPFIKDGRIKITCEQKDYFDAIMKIEKYLESLFLGVLNNESIDTGNRTAGDKRGNVEVNTAGKMEPDKRKGATKVVHSGPRRDFKTKSSERRNTGVEMAKESNTADK